MGDTPDEDRQPLPRPAGPDDVSAHDLLVADLRAFNFHEMTGPVETLVLARKRYGVDKYGTILFKDNGRDYVLDAEDEALDLAVYLRCMIDNNTAPREWLLPLYRDAVWALICLHTYRITGGCMPMIEKYTFPLSELADVLSSNAHSEDDGGAFRATGDAFDGGESIVCGALLRNRKMCILALGEHPDGYGWCPRHGLRGEPTVKPWEGGGEVFARIAEAEDWLDRLEPEDPSLTVERIDREPERAEADAASEGSGADQSSASPTATEGQTGD